MAELMAERLGFWKSGRKGVNLMVEGIWFVKVG